MKKLLLLLLPVLLFSWHQELVPNGSFEYWQFNSDTLPVGHWWGYYVYLDHNPPKKYSADKIDGNYSALMTITHNTNGAYRCRASFLTGGWHDTLYLSFYAKRISGSTPFVLEYGGFAHAPCYPNHRFYNFDTHQWESAWATKEINLTSDWVKYSFVIPPDLNYPYLWRGIAITLYGGSGSIFTDTVLLDSVSLRTKEMGDINVPDTFGILLDVWPGQWLPGTPIWEDNGLRAIYDTLYNIAVQNGWKPWFFFEGSLYSLRRGEEIGNIDWFRNVCPYCHSIGLNFAIWDSIITTIQTRWPNSNIAWNIYYSQRDTIFLKDYWVCGDYPQQWLYENLVSKTCKFLQYKGITPKWILLSNEDYRYDCGGECIDSISFWRRTWISMAETVKKYFPETYITHGGTNTSVNVADSILSYCVQADVLAGFSWHTGLSQYIHGYGSERHSDTTTCLVFGSAFQGQYTYKQLPYNWQYYIGDTIPIIHDEVNVKALDTYTNQMGITNEGGLTTALFNEYMLRSFLNAPYICCAGMNDPVGPAYIAPIVDVSSGIQTTATYNLHKLFLSTRFPGSVITDYRQDNLNGYHLLKFRDKYKRNNIFLTNLLNDTTTVVIDNVKGKFNMHRLQIGPTEKDTTVVLPDTLKLAPFEIAKLVEL